MFRLFLLSGLLSTVIGLPAALAQTPTDSTTAGFAVSAPDAREAADPPYTTAYASTLGSERERRTTIDYRFAPDGLVGSVGYLRVDDRRRLDSPQVGTAASSRSISLVGATITYAFR